MDMGTQEAMSNKLNERNLGSPLKKKDADYVFYELTRSICPNCRKVIDAQVLLRDNKVYMRKRCPDCGPFEALVYGDAKAYTSLGRYNKPGTIPWAFGAEVRQGCPYDCGLCPDHQQHTCLGIIEVNSACNMDCPLCFSEAGPGATLVELEHSRLERHGEGYQQLRAVLDAPGAWSGILELFAKTIASQHEGA